MFKLESMFGTTLVKSRDIQEYRNRVFEIGPLPLEYSSILVSILALKNNVRVAAKSIAKNATNNAVEFLLKMLYVGGQHKVVDRISRLDNSRTCVWFGCEISSFKLDETFDL